MLKRKKGSGGTSSSSRSTQKPAKAAKRAGSSLNLGSVGILLFLLGAAILAGAGFVLLQMFQMQTASLRQSATEMASVHYAARFQGLVTQPAAVLNGLASDPDLQRLLATGDEQAWAARAEGLKRLFPGAMRVRLLPPGVDRVDKSSTPPFGYADLQQLRAAEAGDQVPPVEVILPGSNDAHFNVMRRVANEQGRVLGVIVVIYPATLLQDTVSRLKISGGGVELRQAGSVVLARRGTVQGTSGVVQVPVPGTRWTLIYQAGASGGLLAEGFLPFLAVFGVAALLLGLVIYLLFRTVSSAIRRDQVTILNLVKDILNRNLAPAYPVRMGSSRVTVELLLNMGQEFVATPVAKPASTAPDVPPEAGVGSMFLDSGHIEVQEDEPQVKAPKLDKVPASIFRAYDIRGVVGETLTEEVVETIGRALGSEAYERGQQLVVIGRDGRLSGPALSAALARGFMASGRDVIDIGMAPTPVLYFATQYLRTGTGVAVTGSHNPPNYNGLKMMIRDETLSGDAIQALRVRIQTGNLLSGEGSLSEQSVIDDYVGRITGDVQVGRSLKVVVDCGNGVAGMVAPRLLRELGCEVIELYCEVDGNFPNHHPDPGKPENLKELIAKVQESGAHLGVAFDGDGDRLGVVDEKGKIIYPDRLLMLFAKDLLMRQPGASIIYDVKCTRHLRRVIAENAGQPIMWKTGHSLIKAAMKKTGALLAGEMSGHFFFKERWYGFDDGIYAAARLLEILGAESVPASELFAELPDSVNTPELNIQVAEGEQHTLVEELVNKAQFPDAEVTTIDGVRADFADGFGLVRASNTTPVLVLRFEGDDEAALRRIQEAFRKQLLAVKPDLELPF
ncbi:MAG: phosphomannomutase/phosphoglucomutase [Gammaproteobacteria bacterium]